MDDVSMKFTPFHPKSFKTKANYSRRPTKHHSFPTTPQRPQSIWSSYFRWTSRPLPGQLLPSTVPLVHVKDTVYTTWAEKWCGLPHPMLGQTSRYLTQHIKEHKKALLNDNPTISVLAEHAIAENHTICWLQAEVMDHSFTSLHCLLYLMYINQLDLEMPSFNHRSYVHSPLY